MKKFFNKAVLNGATVIGDGLTYPRIPNVYTGDNEGGYQRGDMMDANAVVEMIKELTDTGEITIEELQNLINEEIQERVEGDQDQQRYTDQKIKDLIGTSPETLDTLKEIADALGEDPDFAANVWNKIAELTTKHNEDVQELQDAITSGFENIDFTPYVKKTDVVTDTTNGLMLASDKQKVDSLPQYIVGRDGVIPGVYDIFRISDDKDAIYVSYDFKNIRYNRSLTHSFGLSSATQSKAGVMSASDKVKLDSLVNYQAGNGIDITGDTISCTLDTSLYSIVTELPETGLPNKIYLLPSTETEEGNIYTEYGYVDNKWEEIGKYKADVDLTPYNRALNLPYSVIKGDEISFLANASKVWFNYKPANLDTGAMPDYKTIDFPEVTTSFAGTMSSSDKVKLDGIEAGAQVNTIESISVNGTPVDPVDKNINLSEVSRTSAGILPAASNNLRGTTIPYFFNYSSPSGDSDSSIKWGKVSFIVPDKNSWNNYCNVKLIIGDNDSNYYSAPTITLVGMSYEGISVDKYDDNAIRIKTKISSDSRNILRILNDGLFVDKTLPNKQDALTEVQLNNINNAITSISINNIGQVNTNGAVNLTIPNATTEQDGMMSKADKTKLDSLENYTLPAATTTTLGGVKISTETIGGAAPNIIHIKEDGTIKATVRIGYDSSNKRIRLYDWEDSGNDLGYVEFTKFPNASITENGLMSKEDKAKLDSQPTIKASDATGVTDNDYVVIKKSELNSILSRLSALENKA